MHSLRQFPFSLAGANIAASNKETAMTTDHSPGADGGVRTLLRVEGVALFAAALLLYAHSGASWKLFAALILAPDLSFAFYLFGPRAGAIAYNAAHSTIGAFILALFSQSGIAVAGLGGASALLPIALIWFAHVGFDRGLGYGLKYASGFSDTHLGTIGRLRHRPA
jgi:hypothetical protein